MNDEKLFEAWKEQRREIRPSDGFADQVAAALPDLEGEQQDKIRGFIAIWIATRWGRAAVCSLAAMIGLLPLGFLVSSLLFSQTATPMCL